MDQRAARKVKKRNAFFQPLFALFQSVSIAFSMIRFYIYRDTSADYLPWFLRMLVALLCCLSFALWFVARRQLGVHLTLLAKADGVLIQKGLYRYFRHPIYYFGTVTMVLYIILINKLKLLFILVLIIPMQYVRSINERRVLRKKFGDDYDDYCEKVWF